MDGRMDAKLITISPKPFGLGIKMYVVTPYLNRLNEAVQINGHNIWVQ